MTLNQNSAAISAEAANEEDAGGDRKKTRYEVASVKTVSGNGSAGFRHLRHYASHDADADDDRGADRNDATGPPYKHASKR